MRERPSARLLVLDRENRVLLFHFVFDEGPLAGQRYWGTPGGALESGESYRDAAQRELREETGILADVGAEVARRGAVFRTPTGDEVFADERYFLVRVSDPQIDESGQESLEAGYMRAYKWWPCAELKTTAETIYPEDLVPLLAKLAVG